MLVLPVRNAVGLLEATRCLSVGLYHCYPVLCRNLTYQCNMVMLALNSASSCAGVLVKVVLLCLQFFCVLMIILRDS